MITASDTVILTPTSLDQQPAKKSRACTNCHVRKVRCNAWEVGTPCTRCKRRKQSGSCVLLGRVQRNGASSRKRQCRGMPSETVRDVASENEAQIDTENQTSSGQRTEHISPFTDNTCIDTRPDARDDPENPPIREEDAHVRIFQEMSRFGPSVVSPASAAPTSDRREVYEYHEGVNPVTIVGEAIGRKRADRLIRISVLNDTPFLDRQNTFPGLDDADMDFLRRKGALNYPSRRVCYALLRLYFDCIYPYAPVLDRASFLRDYAENKQSPFLMQSILANTVPFASKELLKQAGYEDRLIAQKSLCTKARLLYDLGCERSQLRLLQGSVMLGSLHFAYATDKDYRYWLTNAARIAGQIGLHRKCVSEGLDPVSRRLFRRIWWVLYNRDVLLAVSGTDNQRRFSDCDCDTSPLTEDDWEEEDEAQLEFQNILPPVTPLHKTFMIEYGKISVISSNFLRCFKTPGNSPTTEEISILSEQIVSWKQQLPMETQPNRVQTWSVDNIWILILLAMGYRLEAVFCRSAKEYLRVRHDIAATGRLAKTQENAMLELDAIVQKASINDVLHLLPLSFMICASTILAMRIEIALQPSANVHQHLVNKNLMFAELEMIKEASENWSCLIWTIRMFEAVLIRTRLGLGPNSSSELDERTINSISNNTPANFMTYSGDPELSNTTGDLRTTLAPNDPSINPTYMSNADELYNVPRISENYDWLQSLLTPRPINDILDQFDEFC